MRFRPNEATLTKIDPARGISWTCDETTPESIRGLTLTGGVPCFVGHIDHEEAAVKFAVPKGRKDHPVVRTAGRPYLARLAEEYEPSTTPDAAAYVPPGSIRDRLIRQAEADPCMPEGLKTAVRDVRRNWADDEDADYLIHGAN